MIHSLARPTAIAMACFFSVAHAGSERWYDSARLERGGALFARNCAVCHGDQAQGLSDDWRKTDADGNYPPPPLNGTAHTWHHPMKILRKTIREGGAKIGGRMPAFADKLKADDIDAIIAWFQSHWNDAVYQDWAERDAAAGGFAPVSKTARTADKTPPAQISAAKPSPVRAALQKLIPGASIGEPFASPVPGIVGIRAGGSWLYVTKDGRYAFSGDLIDLGDGNNLTEIDRRKQRLSMIADFPLDQRVIYPARGKEKAHITVFTDTSCPFCRKQHAEINTLLDAGVSVHYIPFPRGGRKGPGYAGLRGVWCARDPLDAMTTAKAHPDKPPLPGDCARANAVDAGYQLGNTIGIRGTPATILASGELIDGYRPAKKLLNMLGLPGAR